MNYLNSCQSCFSGVYLVFEVFQDTWRSNKQNPSVYWNAACLVPSWPQIMQIRISFRSRSDLVLAWLSFSNSISFCRRISHFPVFQRKLAHLCFCLVRIKP